MAHLKQPVIGDKLYGRSRTGVIWAERQMLHAAKLSVAHPNTGERMYFSAPLPDDMEELLARLREEQKKIEEQVDDHLDIDLDPDIIE